MKLRDLAGADVHCECRRPRPYVHAHDGQARRGDLISQEGQFLAFGVGSADDVNAFQRPPPATAGRLL